MALTRRDVIRSVRFARADADRIARRFYAAKAAEYRATLLRLANQYGEDRRGVVLSGEIRAALQREARDHARKVIATLNRQIEGEARRRSDLPPYLLGRRLGNYARDRVEARAEQIARNEVATARLDAQVSFFRENGIEPAFDFTGPRAKCPICTKLKNEGPWPVEVVTSIGLPHLNCTHSWRARAYSAAKLREAGLRPGRISAGRGTIAGIVGSDAFVNRHGSQRRAVTYLDGIKTAGQA